MRYNMDIEPGHLELMASVTHPVEQYQPGSERLEKLYLAMEQAQRFSCGDGEVNL